MQITVTIPDEVASQVQAQGLSPEDYVEKLIAEHALSQQVPDLTEKLSFEDFNASLDTLTQFSDEIPLLPIESFSRKSFYEDHD